MQSSISAVPASPASGSVRGVLRSAGDGRVDGRLLVAALGRSAAGHGLVRRSADVERLLADAGRIRGAAAGGEEFGAGWVVLAAGAWSKALAAPLGIAIPVALQRGQICHLRLPGADTGRWPVISAFRGHLRASLASTTRPRSVLSGASA